MAAERDPLEDLASPNCPVHLVPLEPVGEAEDGSDARWECMVRGCGFARLA